LNTIPIAIGTQEVHGILCGDQYKIWYSSIANRLEAFNPPPKTSQPSKILYLKIATSSNIYFWSVSREIWKTCFPNWS